jgi:putative endonuclease
MDTFSSQLPRRTTKKMGDAAELAALQYLTAHGLHLLARNYRTSGRGGGEIDLIMRESDGTVVFVEVRQRTTARFGGAAASIGVTKQRRIIFAARHYVSRIAPLPPCRFDVLLQEGSHIEWIKAAFDAS